MSITSSRERKKGRKQVSQDGDNKVGMKERKRKEEGRHIPYKAHTEDKGSYSKKDMTGKQDEGREE